MRRRATGPNVPGVHLSRPAISIISALHASGPVRLSRLSDLTDLEAPLVSREIARLCEGGYVKRAADPTDGRATIVTLTAKGRKAYAGVPPGDRRHRGRGVRRLEGGRAAHARRLPRAGRPRRESPSGFRIGSLPWSSNSGDVMPAPLVKIDLEFPYTRSVGPVIGAYLDGLEAGRLLASRARRPHALAAARVRPRHRRLGRARAGGGRARGRRSPRGRGSPSPTPTTRSTAVRVRAHQARRRRHRAWCTWSTVPRRRACSTGVRVQPAGATSAPATSPTSSASRWST